MVDKLVGKLIRSKIIEITVVIVMVLISIPVWNTFGKKISKANVIDIDQCNLAFGIENSDNGDILIVTNEYKFNKSFRITLRVNKEINIEKSSLIINDKVYKLTDFDYNKRGYNTYFTIVADYISSDTFTYKVIPNLDGMIINYAYIFEENINF